MSIRLPLYTVAQFTDTDTGTASVAGGVAHNFNVPQDTDNIVVKVTASVVGAGASVVLQTTDDGGTTWWDVARTSVVSNGLAQWISAPVINPGIATGQIKSASVISTGIGNPGASTLGSQQVSGMPILSQLNRVFTIYTGNITTSSVVTTVKVNSQTPSGQ